MDATDSKYHYDSGNNEKNSHNNGCNILIIRKSLLTPKSNSKEDWQHTNIFYSICIVKDKVYNLFIDSGSYENAVSTGATKKFQLTNKNNPKPYKLTRLNRDTEVIIDKRCLVFSFKRHKYFDSTWYDVVSMDACHVLLWWPW
jgi:hypothetical protein